MTTDATTTQEQPAAGEPRHTFQRVLRVRLTPEERLAKAHARETAEAEIDRLAAELDEIKESYRDRVKGLEERAAKARADFATGTEERPVACVEEPLFEQNAVLIRRVDTGEVIDKRAMEGDERQLEIDLPADDVHDGPAEREGGESNGSGEAEKVPSLWMMPNMVETPPPDAGQLWVARAAGHEGTVLRVEAVDGTKVKLRRGEAPWKKEAGGPETGSYDVANAAFTKRFLNVEAKRLASDYAFLCSAQPEPAEKPEAPPGTVVTTSSAVRARREKRKADANGAADPAVGEEGDGAAG